MSEQTVFSVTGVWYDGASSKRWPACLKLSEHDASLICEQQLQQSQLHQQLKPGALRISDRLGNTPRVIFFEDGSQFETTDNAGIDRWLALHKVSHFSGFIHAMERRWHAVLASVAVLVVLFFALWQWGIPFLVKEAAFRLPDDALSRFSGDTLKLLDDKVLRPSALPEQRQKDLAERFARLAKNSGAKHDVPVVFRQMQGMPNAFAILDARIVVTDDLVRFSQNDEELDAVFLHELGHIEQRHGLRALIQSSSLVLLWTALSGDSSVAASSVVSAPLVLMQLGYSREFEREADHYALTMMQKNSIPLVSFSNIMQRMESCFYHQNKPASAPGKVMSLEPWLENHPGTSERIAAFGAADPAAAACPPKKPAIENTAPIKNVTNEPATISAGETIKTSEPSTPQ